MGYSSCASAVWLCFQSLRSIVPHTVSPTSRWIPRSIDGKNRPGNAPYDRCTICCYKTNQSCSVGPENTATDKGAADEPGGTPKTRMEECCRPPKVSPSFRWPRVRTRVLSHMSKLMMGGVGLYTLGCTGFGCVDPLQSIALRRRTAQTHRNRTNWYVSDPMGLLLEVKLTPTMGRLPFRFDGSPLHQSGATLVSSQVDPVTGVLTIRLLPAGTTNIGVFLGATCQGASRASFDLSITPSMAPKVGDVVVVR